MNNMQALDAVWSDADDDAPFAASVDETIVLETFMITHANDALDARVCAKVQQWIKWNRWMNMDEDPSHQMRVDRIHSRMLAVMRSVECKTFLSND